MNNQHGYLLDTSLYGTGPVIIEAGGDVDRKGPVINSKQAEQTTTTSAAAEAAAVTDVRVPLSVVPPPSTFQQFGSKSQPSSVSSKERPPMKPKVIFEASETRKVYCCTTGLVHSSASSETKQGAKLWVPPTYQAFGSISHSTLTPHFIRQRCESSSSSDSSRQHGGCCDMIVGSRSKQYKGSSVKPEVRRVSSSHKKAVMPAVHKKSSSSSSSSSDKKAVVVVHKKSSSSSSSNSHKKAVVVVGKKSSSSSSSHKKAVVPAVHKKSSSSSSSSSHKKVVPAVHKKSSSSSSSSSHKKAVVVVHKKSSSSSSSSSHKKVVVPAVHKKSTCSSSSSSHKAVVPTQAESSNVGASCCAARKRIEQGTSHAEFASSRRNPSVSSVAETKTCCGAGGAGTAGCQGFGLCETKAGGAGTTGCQGLAGGAGTAGCQGFGLCETGAGTTGCQGLAGGTGTAGCQSFGLCEADQPLAIHTTHGRTSTAEVNYAGFGGRYKVASADDATYVTIVNEVSPAQGNATTASTKKISATDNPASCGYLLARSCACPQESATPMAQSDSSLSSVHQARPKIVRIQPGHNAVVERLHAQRLSSASSVDSAGSGRGCVCRTRNSDARIVKIPSQRRPSAASSSSKVVTPIPVVHHKSSSSSSSSKVVSPIPVVHHKSSSSSSSSKVVTPIPVVRRKSSSSSSSSKVVAPAVHRKSSSSSSSSKVVTPIPAVRLESDSHVLAPVRDSVDSSVKPPVVGSFSSEHAVVMDIPESEIGHIQASEEGVCACGDLKWRSNGVIRRRCDGCSARNKSSPKINGHCGLDTSAVVACQRTGSFAADHGAHQGGCCVTGKDHQLSGAHQGGCCVAGTSHERGCCRESNVTTEGELVVTTHATTPMVKKIIPEENPASCSYAVSRACGYHAGSDNATYVSSSSVLVPVRPKIVKVKAHHDVHVEHIRGQRLRGSSCSSSCDRRCPITCCQQKASSLKYKSEMPAARKPYSSSSSTSSSSRSRKPKPTVVKVSSSSSSSSTSKGVATAVDVATDVEVAALVKVEKSSSGRRKQKYPAGLKPMTIVKDRTGVCCGTDEISRPPVNMACLTSRSIYHQRARSDLHKARGSACR